MSLDKTVNIGHLEDARGVTAYIGAALLQMSTRMDFYVKALSNVEGDLSDDIEDDITSFQIRLDELRDCYESLFADEEAMDWSISKIERDSIDKLDEENA